MLTINNIPLSVYNRALELYGCERKKTVEHAATALDSAQSRIDIQPIELTVPFEKKQNISAFACAMAEYLSLSGPWSEEDGEYVGEGGYITRY